MCIYARVNGRDKSYIAYTRSESYIAHTKSSGSSEFLRAYATELWPSGYPVSLLAIYIGLYGNAHRTGYIYIDHRGNELVNTPTPSSSLYVWHACLTCVRQISAMEWLRGSRRSVRSRWSGTVPTPAWTCARYSWWWNVRSRSQIRTCVRDIK